MEPKQRRFSIGYTIATLVALLLIESYLFAPHPETLAYSDFMRLLKAGKVSDLTLSKQAIRGTLAANGLEAFLPREKLDELKQAGKGTHRFVTTRVDDPELVRVLEAANVRFTGTAENGWLPLLASWVVPAVVFFGLWSFLVRRMGDAQGNLMSIGRSKAKVYVERATGVSFDDVAGMDEARAELMEIVDFLNQLLAELDGFDSSRGVIIMAATNRPEILDPALLRPGRFDRKVVVDRPDLKGRAMILRVHTRGVTLAPGVDLVALAARTPGFVGADLANLVNEAALGAARANKNAVEMADFDEAIDRVVGGLERRSRLIGPREKHIVAHHEAGHAIVAELRPRADRVHKISIIPRGVAALGYTEQAPTEDRYLMTRSELLDRLDVLLGGRVAEEIIFGDVSTGAADDLRRATGMARHMVAQYSMSEKLGLATFEEPRETFLGVGGSAPREYSEATAQAIDVEIAAILEEAHGRVRETLTSRRGALEALAKLLIDKEVINAEQLRDLLDP